MAFLSIQNVYCGYYAGIDILQDLSLQVDQGAFIGIIGPNGAGKSTLLKTIFGFLKYREGRVLFRDRETGDLSPFEIKKLGVSYIPQGSNNFPHMTIEENLLLGAWTFRGQKERIKEGLAKVYDIFPVLYEKKKQKAEFLSGGEAKILSIAKEMMSSPVLLLVDEPSAGLAPKIVSYVYAFLRSSQEKGITILLVDQNINQAIDHSQYLYMLEMGSVALEGSAEMFRENLRDIIRDSLLGT
ncbi:MAG: ABC transporter ATP-binding protein [Desulfobacterales bacterium]|nr:MAG: ABC transporter ATP-binding protein [Desulfobacterales bacterium]